MRGQHHDHRRARRPDRFVCVWCDATAVDRSVFPACATRCKDAAARHSDRALGLWRPARRTADFLIMDRRGPRAPVSISLPTRP